MKLKRKGLVKESRDFRINNLTGNIICSFPSYSKQGRGHSSFGVILDSRDVALICRLSGKRRTDLEKRVAQNPVTKQFLEKVGILKCEDIELEILRALKITESRNKNGQEYFKFLIDELQKVPDKIWNTFSEKTKHWINYSTTRENNGEAILGFKQFEAIIYPFFV
jgi:hypothetical protein